MAKKAELGETWEANLEFVPRVVALALENLPAGAPLIVKPDRRASLAELDELWRSNAVAPYDVPEGAKFEVEVK